MFLTHMLFRSQLDIQTLICLNSHLGHLFDSVAILSILLYSVLQPEELIRQAISVGVLTSWQPSAKREPQQEMGAGKMMNEVSGLRNI